MSKDQAVIDLQAAQKNLPPSGREFAGSLIKQFYQYKELSEKQWQCVYKLLDQANGVGQPLAPVVPVGSFQNVIALFNLAKAKLQYPKINLLVGQQPIQLSLSGNGSSRPGTVNVTDGKPYGQNTWFGRVTPEGVWEQGQSARAKTGLDEVGKFLQAFGADPAGTAKTYGRLTGKCCFCGKPLSDERSTAAGFGPVCAQNFGLVYQWKAAQAVLENAA